jgi:translocation and assembly module TamB
MAVRPRLWRCFLVLLAAPLVLALMLLLAANTSPGRRWLMATVSRVTDGAVVIEELSGRLPLSLHAGRIFLSDGQGVWLALESLDLAWSPARLVSGSAHVDRLSAARVTIKRRPAGAAKTQDNGEPTRLPVRIELDALSVGRLELDAGVLGEAGRAFSLQACADFASLDQGLADLSLTSLDGQDRYRLHWQTDRSGVLGRVRVQERSGGLIAALTGLAAAGPLDMDVHVQGPRDAVGTAALITAGPARLQLGGTLNLVAGGADLAASGTTSAMQLVEGIAWQAASLQASIVGPFETIAANGHFLLRGLEAAATSLHELKLDWHGDAGRLHVEGRAEGLRLPVASPEHFAESPLLLAGDADLGAQTVNFTLRHPLAEARGHVAGFGPLTGEVSLQLPELSPLAELAGLSLKGRSNLSGRFDWRDQQLGLSLDGAVAITEGQGPLPGLVGESGRLAGALAFKGNDVKLERLRMDGRSLRFEAAGGLARDLLDFAWTLALPNLKQLAPEISGHLTAKGALSGPRQSFAARVDANGELAVRNLPKGALALKLESSGLPSQPEFALSAKGALAGSDLQLLTRLQNSTAGWRLSVERARWQSLRADGALSLAKGAAFPTGNLDLACERLSDLAPLVGTPLAGSLAAALSTREAGGRQQARLVVEGSGLSLMVGLSGQALKADVSVFDPLGRWPVLDGTLNLDGWTWKETQGHAQLKASGALDALDFTLQGGAHGLAGSDLALAGAGRLDLPASLLTLGELSTTWRQETLKLLQPVRFRFGDGLGVDRLRLGLRTGELDVRGRFAPRLDVSANLSGLPASLAAAVQPGLLLDGAIAGNVRLIGPVSAPRGEIAMNGDGLRARSGPGSGLPAAKLRASARLDGFHADLDAGLTAGSGLNLKVAGLVPLSTQGQFALKGGGRADLKLLEPLLAAGGRRARGRLSLDGSVAGSLAEPRINGRIVLEQGEWQDYVQGMHLLGLSGLAQAEGDSLRLVRLQGRAGTGSLSAQGSLVWKEAGWPLDFRIAARKATLLSSERLEANLDADVELKGRLNEKLTVGGNLKINRAEIRIPERMPANIAVLNVRDSGTEPPRAIPEKALDLALNLKLSAPSAVFVRGRGLDAELGGTVRLRGSLQNLQPEGGFFMRRGQISLAGQTLNFSRGVVGFDGGRITDPSLNFLAESGNGSVTAKLEVTGTAQKPKISLSSSPSLPQDEVLAQLLFGRVSSSLSPFELVQIGAALASLAGLTPTGGDALGGVRERLGLDRLSFGGGGKGPTLEGGRYVAPGVYVGAKQGASLNSTQGTVQIDVSRALKLEASVGTGSATGSTGGASSSVGVIYQFEY